MDRIELLRKQLRDNLPSVWEEPFHKEWLANEGCDLRVRSARAQAAEMAAVKPLIKPGELIIGGDQLHPIISGKETPFGNGFRLDKDRADALKQERPEAADEIDQIVSYWEKWLSDNSNCVALTCHASLAYQRVIGMGIDGLREYVKTWREKNIATRPDCAQWYDALVITLDGVSAFIAAHARAAEESAAQAETPERRAELERIAAACRRIAHGRPRSFYEATQLFYLVFLLCGHDSPGPIDRYLYPPLKRDLDSGSITLEQAQEIVDCLWLKFEEKTAYGATLAGQLRDGSDASNELSLLCVNAIRRLRLLSPRTAVRWHPNISEELFERACETVADGASYPAFVNDEAIIPAAVERGVSLEDAREYTFVGCGQTFPHGRGHGNYEDVIINAAKPLELALHGGIDPVTGERAGPDTRKPSEFRTYEEFERTYRLQMDTMISENIRRINERRRAIKDHAYDFLRSLLTHSCVESGLDWHAGGADYCEGMVDMVGLTTVTDSLAAIKIGVFEQKAISLEELVKVLDQNWEGEEALRQYFLRKLPKFGNESPEADSTTAAEADRINEFIKTHRTCFGGPWGMDIIGWSGAVIYGEQTGATPDGRRFGEPLADCAGPAQGRNVLGLTATLSSTLKLPHRASHGPLAMSLRFPKEAVRGREGRAKLRAVVETYFRQGGQQLQISIASTEDMKAAQKAPEAHRSLMVRVGGFSAYFVELDNRFQADLIVRSEMEI